MSSIILDDELKRIGDKQGYGSQAYLNALAEKNGTSTLAYIRKYYPYLVEGKINMDTMVKLSSLEKSQIDRICHELSKENIPKEYYSQILNCAVSTTAGLTTGSIASLTLAALKRDSAVQITAGAIASLDGKKIITILELILKIIKIIFNFL